MIIEFTISWACYETLRVYNILGEEVSTLSSGEHVYGTFKVAWDASDMPSGVYFCRLTTKDYVQAKKMILARYAAVVMHIQGVQTNQSSDMSGVANSRRSIGAPSFTFSPLRISFGGLLLFSAALKISDLANFR